MRARAALLLILAAAGALSGCALPAPGCAPLQVSVTPAVMALGDVATISGRFTACAAAGSTLGDAGQPPAMGSLVASFSWNGSRWDLAENGSALNFSYPDAGSLRPIAGPGVRFMKQGESSAASMAWNGTFERATCNNQGDCVNVAFTPAPPGRYVVDVLVAGHGPTQVTLDVVARAERG